MTPAEKQLITKEIKRLVKQSSQVKLARKARVSPATISQLLNGNWDLIKPEMWRKIKVRLKIELNWTTAPIRIYRELTELLGAAKHRHLTYSFSHKAGSGKTQLFVDFQKTLKNVIYVEGDRTMSKKTFIKSLLINAGQDSFGTTEQLKEQFIDHVSELENPLIIIDQFDKLKEGAFDLFMDFYNELWRSCGFIISGVGALEKRILMGVQRQKIGYEEIWSRMNRKFIKLHPTSLKDVELICKANGVDDMEVIHESYNTCEGDLRRVRQDVEKYHLINS